MRENGYHHLSAIDDRHEARTAQLSRIRNLQREREALYLNYAQIATGPKGRGLLWSLLSLLTDPQHVWRERDARRKLEDRMSHLDQEIIIAWNELAPLHLMQSPLET